MVENLGKVERVMYSGQFWKNKTLKNQKRGAGMESLIYQAF